MNDFFQEVQNKYSYLDNVFSNIWASWISLNRSIKIQFKNTKWRNSKAKDGNAYIPTDVEKLANVVTHGMWIIPAVIAAYTLFERSNSSSQILVSCIYGGALVLLFTVSTFFHCSCYCTNNTGLKNVLHRCDRAMIYVFIAGSYFPWLQLQNDTHSSLLFSLEWIIWILAAIGITYQQIFHERFKCLETCIYLLMGLGPAIIVILTGHEFHGLPQLKLGGLFYIIGICFFKSDGVIPMAHAIWHLFVVLAAAFHYFAILVYLYPKDSNH